MGLRGWIAWPFCVRPARKPFMYARVGLHLIALLTITAFVGMSTSVSALQASLVGRPFWGP
jgi:hypothetical protein